MLPMDTQRYSPLKKGFARKIPITNTQLDYQMSSMMEDEAMQEEIQKIEKMEKGELDDSEMGKTQFKKRSRISPSFRKRTPNEQSPI